jgi:MFS family permease
MRKKLEIISPLGWNIIVGTLIARMVFFMSMPFISIYLTQKKGIDPATVGLIIASSFMVGLLSSLWGGTISDYFGTKKILQIIPFVWGIVFIMFAVVDSVPMFFLINCLHGLCQSIFEPASKKALSQSSTEENRKMIYNYRYTAII